MPRFLVSLARLLLVAAGVLLCLALLLLNFNPLALSFQTTLVVSNGTDVPFTFTPLGIAEGSGAVRPLPRFVMSGPLLPAVRLGRFEIGPGGQKSIMYDRDDIRFSSILVRDAHGGFRELPVDAASAAEFRIESLDVLPAATPDAIAAEQAYFLNWHALILYLPLTGPLWLALAWYLGRRMTPATSS